MSTNNSQKLCQQIRLKPTSDLRASSYVATPWGYNFTVEIFLFSKLVNLILPSFSTTDAYIHVFAAC